jgi:hypothetical protein
MTNVEAAQLLAIFKVAYPYAYKDFGNEMALDSISMWQSKFADVPFEVMLMAWDRYCMENKFAPTFADFCECLRAVHYQAWFDLTQAKFFEDYATMERCKYVLDATERFRECNVQALNYNLISDEKLRLRAHNPQYLNQEVKYIE